MKNIFKDKVVVITGASSGIGEATAREFAKSGSKVVLAARSEERLSRIVDEIREAEGDAIYVTTDVSIEEDCKNLIRKTVEKYGTVHILVNNAGLSMRATFVDVDLKVLHRLMNVNFWGTVYCTKYALPYLLQQKGSLVGVSSVAGFHGLPGRTGYSASKFAIHGFLETIRIENLKKGLHVMILAPGFTTTNMLAQTPRKVLENIKARVPLGRFGRPEEVANAYLFLACDEASYITGTVIRVDGGLVIGT